MVLSGGQKSYRVTGETRLTQPEPSDMVGPLLRAVIRFLSKVRCCSGSTSWCRRLACGFGPSRRAACTTKALAGVVHGLLLEGVSPAPGAGACFSGAEKVRYSTVAPFLNSSKLILPAPTWSSSRLGALTINFAGSATVDLGSAGLPRPAAARPISVIFFAPCA